LATIQELDLSSIWAEADDDERRVQIEELLEWVTVYPHHLEVTVTGAPPLNVLFQGGWTEGDVRCPGASRGAIRSNLRTRSHSTVRVPWGRLSRSTAPKEAREVAATVLVAGLLGAGS
jgi:hypothetical protein